MVEAIIGVVGSVLIGSQVHDDEFPGSIDGDVCAAGIIVPETRLAIEIEQDFEHQFDFFGFVGDFRDPECFLGGGLEAARGQFPIGIFVDPTDDGIGGCFQGLGGFLGEVSFGEDGPAFFLDFQDGDDFGGNILPDAHGRDVCLGFVRGELDGVILQDISPADSALLEPWGVGAEDPEGLEPSLHDRMAPDVLGYGIFA